MGRAKLAICMENPQYQERFIKCVMHHYEEKYELHSFSHPSDFYEEKNRQFDLFILEGVDLQVCVDILRKEDRKILYLQENNRGDESSSNLVYMQMYQEVYKIMEGVEKLLGVREAEPVAGIKRIGVYSVSCPSYQIPYCSMLASIYGETKSVLVLNLLPYSGMMEEEVNGLCLEDLIAAISTGNLLRESILEGIGHRQKWDFIYPVKNTEHLAEIDGKSYEALVDYISKERGYEIVIINFGASFSGMLELMDSCQEFYLLDKKEFMETWREDDFKKEVERRGKNEFLNRISKIQISSVPCVNETWAGIAEKWEWGAQGDYIRNRMRMEKASG